jgi:hypothetical protein
MYEGRLDEVMTEEEYQKSIKEREGEEHEK